MFNDLLAMSSGGGGCSHTSGTYTWSSSSSATIDIDLNDVDLFYGYIVIASNNHVWYSYRKGDTNISLNKDRTYHYSTENGITVNGKNITLPYYSTGTLEWEAFKWT